VLEAAARLRDHVEEQVLVVGQETPHLPVLLHEMLEILGRAGAVERVGRGSVHEVVLLAVDGELVNVGIADDDR
jgi:hypothetical protein